MCGLGGYIHRGQIISPSSIILCIVHDSTQRLPHFHGLVFGEDSDVIAGTPCSTGHHIGHQQSYLTLHSTLKNYADRTACTFSITSQFVNT